ncbi:Uncharacterised protein [Mycobacteroides abscessus subsp. abscessus]|nr:Uncharacterised protein [Mycobacteroides abscessus subsp. abscessus]
MILSEAENTPVVGQLRFVDAEDVEGACRIGLRCAPAQLRDPARPTRDGAVVVPGPESGAADHDHVSKESMRLR